MFYCAECQIRNRWPASLVKSLGTCEECGKQDLCNGVNSSDLPDLSKITIGFPLLIIDLEIFDAKGRLLAKCWREDVANFLLTRLNGEEKLCNYYEDYSYYAGGEITCGRMPMKYSPWIDAGRPA